MAQIHCPACGALLKYERAAELPAFPFCSERCRMVDLGRWLDGDYRISEPVLGEEGQGGEEGEQGGRSGAADGEGGAGNGAERGG